MLGVILENGSWETNEEIGRLCGFHMGCMFIYLCAQCQGKKGEKAFGHLWNPGFQDIRLFFTENSVCHEFQGQHCEAT